jgi:hypothetical protein
MRSLNPAVLDENDPSKIDPSLDPFDTKNGYNPNGLSVYSSEFMDRYFTAQAARMNRLIDKALAMREEIKQGKGKVRPGKMERLTIKSAGQVSFLKLSEIDGISVRRAGTRSSRRPQSSQFRWPSETQPGPRS